jgi:hypothetical protein
LKTETTLDECGFILSIFSAKSPASGANSKTKAAAFNADEKDEDNAKEREGK